MDGSVMSLKDHLRFADYTTSGRLIVSETGAMSIVLPAMIRAPDRQWSPQAPVVSRLTAMS
jgi:hypothetical protein